MTGTQWNAVLRRVRSLAAAREDLHVSDADLLGRFVARRDEAAFTQLVSAHARFALDFARRSGCSPSDADDVVQQAFTKLLQERGLAFTEIDVMTDPARRQEMIERAGGRRTVPQIFINGRSVGGYEELYALDQAGRLMPMLQAAE